SFVPVLRHTQARSPPPPALTFVLSFRLSPFAFEVCSVPFPHSLTHQLRLPPPASAAQTTSGGPPGPGPTAPPRDRRPPRRRGSTPPLNAKKETGRLSESGKKLVPAQASRPRTLPYSHERAYTQWRLAVATEMPSAWAASGRESPAK